MAQQEESPEVTFGNQVRKARETRGWTQDRLRRVLREAAGLDLSSTAMTRLEQGKRPIRLNEVAALASVLDLSLDRYANGPVRLTQDEYERAAHGLEQLRAREAEADQRLQVAKEAAAAAITEEAAARQALDAVRRQLARLEATLDRYERGRQDLLEVFGYYDDPRVLDELPPPSTTWVESPRQ